MPATFLLTAIGWVLTAAYAYSGIALVRGPGLDYQILNGLPVVYVV